VSALVKKLWQIAWNMWDLRNSTEHKHDEKALSERITAEIQAILAQSHQPEGAFHPTKVARLMVANLSYKQEWMKNIKSAEQRALRKIQNDDSIQQMRTTLRNFLNQKLKKIIIIIYIYIYIYKYIYYIHSISIIYGAAGLFNANLRKDHVKEHSSLSLNP
jgi:Fe2+ transport system protein B